MERPTAGEAQDGKASLRRTSSIRFTDCNIADPFSSCDSFSLPPLQQSNGRFAAPSALVNPLAMQMGAPPGAMQPGQPAPANASFMGAASPAMTGGAPPSGNGAFGCPIS